MKSSVGTSPAVSNSPPNKMKVIKLLTDGVPNIEPNRGHEYELEKYFNHHDFKCILKLVL